MTNSCHAGRVTPARNGAALDTVIDYHDDGAYDQPHEDEAEYSAPDVRVDQPVYGGEHTRIIQTVLYINPQVQQ